MIEGNSKLDKWCRKQQEKQLARLNNKSDRLKAEEAALQGIGKITTGIFSIAAIIGATFAFGIWGLAVILIIMAAGASTQPRGE